MPPTAIERIDLTANGLAFEGLAAGPAKGPLLLLLHGFPVTAHDWSNQMAPLASLGYRVVAPNQRGYGRSARPGGVASYRLDVLVGDVLAFADALGHETFSIVGHDWGGIVAWRVASDHPRRLDRLGIINAPNLDVTFRHLLTSPLQLVKSSYVAFFQLPWIPEMMLSSMDHGLLVRALQASSLAGAFSDADLAEYKDAWSQPGALEAMLGWYRALPSLPSRTPVRITVPTQVVWGDRDTALDASLADESAALCDRVAVHHVADATHWVHRERAVEVNAVLTRFLG